MAKGLWVFGSTEQQQEQRGSNAAGGRPRMYRGSSIDRSLCVLLPVRHQRENLSNSSPRFTTWCMIRRDSGVYMYVSATNVGSAFGASCGDDINMCAATLLCTIDGGFP